MAVAIIAYWIGAILDVYTTKRAILDGSLGLRERNPVARFFLKWGLPGLVVMKILVFAPFLQLGCRPGLESYGMAGLWIMAAVQLAAAWNNRRLIRKRKET